MLSFFPPYWHSYLPIFTVTATRLFFRHPSSFKICGFVVRAVVALQVAHLILTCGSLPCVGFVFGSSSLWISRVCPCFWLLDGKCWSDWGVVARTRRCLCWFPSTSMYFGTWWRSVWVRFHFQAHSCGATRVSQPFESQVWVPLRSRGVVFLHITERVRLVLGTGQDESGSGMRHFCSLWLSVNNCCSLVVCFPIPTPSTCRCVLNLLILPTI